MLVALEIFVKNPPKGLGRRFRMTKAQTLKEVAWLWHREIMPRHFTPGNISRYRMKSRSQFYRQVIKPKEGQGQGRYVDLLLKGQTLRWLRAFATVTGTSYQSTLRLRAPAYFTRPFIGTFTDPRTGKRKRITQQPDKVAELRQVSAEDKAQMVRFARRGIMRGWNMTKANSA